MAPPQNFFKFFFEIFNPLKNGEKMKKKISKNYPKYTHVLRIICENFKNFPPLLLKISRIEFSAYEVQ